MNIHKNINRVDWWSFQLPHPIIFVSFLIVFIASLATISSTSRATHSLSSINLSWSIRPVVSVLSVWECCIFHFIDFGWVGSSIRSHHSAVLFLHCLWWMIGLTHSKGIVFSAINWRFHSGLPTLYCPTAHFSSTTTVS